MSAGSSARLARLTLTAQIKHKIGACSYETVRDVLKRDPIMIMEEANLFPDEVDMLRSEASKSILNDVTSVWDLYTAEQQSDPHYLNFANIPGLRVHKGINEIVGGSGVGKSQLMMMLSVLSCLPVSEGGLGGQVIFIDTEHSFSSERILQIAQECFPKLFSTSDELKQLASSIHIYNASSPSALLDILNELEEKIIECDVKIIIIDGIASTMRSHYSSSSSSSLSSSSFSSSSVRSRDQSSMLSRIASQLKFLCDEFSLPAVVTNQISFTGSVSSDVSSEHVIVSALGVVWAHSVNTRFLMADGVINLAKSPVYPAMQAAYQVCGSGVLFSK